MRDNLQRGGYQHAPGAAPALIHGARSHHPQRSPEWSPAVTQAIDDLEGRVAGELRDADGNLQPWAVPSVEAVALLRVAAARVERYLASREARGTIKPTDVELASKVAERYHRGLEREALTLRSRLDGAKAAAQIDLARKWAEDD